MLLGLVIMAGQIYVISIIAREEGRNRILWGFITFFFIFFVTPYLRTGFVPLDFFMIYMGGMFLSFILMFLLNLMRDKNVFSIFQTFKQPLDFLRIKMAK